jgi:hypothetical protein
MTIRYNQKSSSGNANTLVAGSAVNGTGLELGDNTRRKVHALSALVTVLAETNTFTWSGKWQVSNDNSTFVDLANGPQNAAAVVLATGTAGADVAVSKSIPAPDAVYGWRYARFVLVTGVATGAAADTYAMGYCFRTNSQGD